MTRNIQMTGNKLYILMTMVMLITGSLSQVCEAAVNQEHAGALHGRYVLAGTKGFRSGIAGMVALGARIQEQEREEKTVSGREAEQRAWHEPILVRILIFVAVLLMIYLVMRLLYHRQNLKYSWKMERMEKAKIKEINEAKIRFFTDLSHDLKTPLTLIQGPIEKLYRSDRLTVEEVQKMLPVIYRNSSRLIILIEELLTFRKLNDGRLPMSASRQDITAFLASILDYYDAPVRERKIRVERSFPLEPTVAWFDPFKLEQVFHNLFSNALKYGNAGGRMKVSLALLEEKDIHHKVPAGGSSAEGSKKEQGEGGREPGTVPWMKISVFNEAEPVPPGKLEHLFDRFYKLDEKSSGTGIGLSVVKSLVELHHGFITARSSRELGGVEFEILLPRDDTYLKESEKRTSYDYTPMAGRLPGASKTVTGEDADAGTGDARAKKKFSVLLIEDNHDLREFLVHSLEHDFRVWAADNGKSGLELAQEHMPDIVVSDVVMPVMDGFEVVRHLKEDIQTSHIPVVLLTARTADTDKITGYRSGADAYVEKPFNLEVLEEQIRRVIRNRQIMQKNFKEWVNKKEKPEELSPEDHSFVALINKHIEANLSKGEISVNDISEAVGLSTTQVYRKVKALTNYTPIEYIRYRKLTRAQELLPNHKYSIKEIAYMSGFNDPSYFGKCFKGEFGLSPQAFRENYVEYEIRERGEENQDG